MSNGDMRELSDRSTAQRQQRARLLAELRYADTASDAMLRCAELIEQRPAALHDTDVHHLLEACVGIGTEGADVLQTAAGMFRAYRLGELPHGVGCGLVALLRLPAAHGTPSVSVSHAISQQRKRRRARRVQETNEVAAATGGS